MEPRGRVTETTFQIAPPLLGVVLATLKGRAVALSLDLLRTAVVARGGADPDAPRRTADRPAPRASG